MIRIRKGSRVGLAGVTIALLASGSHEHARAQQDRASDARREMAAGVDAHGQSSTLLPDGRILIIGGTDSRSMVAIRDAAGRTTVLPTHPAAPRAWHSATLLSDGTVLVVGGVDGNGRTIGAPERFVPSTQSFEPLPEDGFAPRARHTATLLSDGRVLIAGGSFAGARDDAEIWDPVAEVARPVAGSLQQPRAGHTATLLADGRVLLSSDSGSPHGPNEVFNPATGRFEGLTDPVLEPRDAAVMAATPANGARDVNTSLVIGVRFSHAVDLRSVTSVTARVTGPDGDVPALQVPAEAGRLLFLNLVAPLEPGSTYTVALRGLTTADGRAVRDATWSFTTRPADTSATSQADIEEIWNPARSTAWRVDAGRSPWQSLPPLMAPAGTTALAGQVLRLDGRPLAHVTLRIDGLETRTNDTGRFLLLLPGVTAGRHQLGIEGKTANRPGRTYGFFEAGLTIATGVTNVLPYTIWMPRLDTAHVVRIPSPTTSETVITTPFIPGLELHLPAGSVLKDEEGHIVREVGITPIPVDRPPFPLAKNVEVPIYFTIQPGGAYVSNVRVNGPKGAQLVYPNYRHTATGVIANFWHYDPDVRDWYVYGPGVVKGNQVFPDPRTRIYEFTGAMINSNNTPPAKGRGNGPSKSDPIDVSTGLFVLEKTDLQLPDVIPISLHRTYRPADSATRSFGIGATQDYSMFLWSASQYTEADLVTPDGNRIHYTRTSGGTGWTDAVFEQSDSPTAFFKSKITWNGQGWDLRLRDGTVYVFGENAPLQAIRDRFGNTVEVHHANGQSGNVTRVVSPNGRWIEFTYDGSNRITLAKDNIGRTVGYQYDVTGRLWKVTDVLGGVTEYTYDTSHRLLTIKDPRGIVYLTNQYDTNDRVTLQTLANNATYSLSYTLDGSGKVTRTDVTDPRGHISRTTFDSSGYSTSEVEAVGLPEQRTTTFTRDPMAHRLTSVADQLGRRTDYGYDANGNLTSVTRLAGTANAVTTSFTYESAFSQPVTVTDALNHTASFTYDTLGRLTMITDPLSHQMTFTYSVSGQPLTVTNDLNETVTFGYDRGDMINVTNALGQTITRFVDGAGRVLRIADALGRSIRYTYDALNEVTGITDASNGQTTFTYDGNSNLLTLTDANNHTTTWTYDNMDRLASMTDAMARGETYSYDQNGNLSQVIDRKNQVTAYTYDPLDRVTLATFHDGSTTAYVYDAGDRVTEISDSIGGTISRSYDGLDALTSETTAEGTIGYTYDAVGRRATMSVPGQTQVSYVYDAAGRLTSITQGANAVSFAYDGANRRTSLTLPNGIVTEYTSDAASHLTGLTYKLSGSTIGGLTYSYDAAGQRSGVSGLWARTTLPASLGSATYGATNQITAWEGTSFAYDSNGNLTSDGVNSYSWNARNQLANITGGSPTSFVYDGDGRRRSRTAGGTTTTYLYDEATIVKESTGGAASATVLAGPNTDEYFVRGTGSTTSQFLSDALGSTLALTDGAGTVQTSYTYEPFGAVSATGSTDSNAQLFTGREQEGATNLHYFRARYYDSRLQRFLSEDPIGVTGGMHLYAYADNAPTEYIDPFGFKPRPGGGPTIGPRRPPRPGGGPAIGPTPGRKPSPPPGQRVGPPVGRTPHMSAKPPCDAFCRMATDVARRSGAMADASTYVELIVASVLGGALGAAAAEGALTPAGQALLQSLRELGQLPESALLDLEQTAPGILNKLAEVLQGIAPTPSTNLTQLVAGFIKDVIMGWLGL